ncbi:uncharacterized protein LOC128147893 isoform X1 [Harpia harpyja]|uniref:uncharacterized protein LOC128147893 isoform X1 n=1 Tax=Harpia harpyja TaxID=202280 RepID=UPI0022B0ED4E|nr:uncharacterized protein LOC128147893 isoform X1 [Harpia harpyja]XP_052657070.1 uncharacterized protein LOC128147893 isoform X1 [Harpia harpyja]XP_052657071.1 uncharacterized protein LOC128147893 isoform X1 [Harpia harpyja]
MRSLLWRRSVSSWVMSVHPALSQVKDPHPQVGSEPCSRLLLCHPRKQLFFSQQVIFLSGFQPMAHQCITRLQLPAHQGSPAPSSAVSDPKGRAPSTAPAPSPPASARITLPDGTGAWPHRAGCCFPFECWKSSSEPVSARDEHPCGSRASWGGTHSPVGHRRAQALRCSLTCSWVQWSQTPSGRKISLSPSNWQWKLCWELPPCNAGMGLVTPPLGFSLSQPKTGKHSSWQDPFAICLFWLLFPSLSILSSFYPAGEDVGQPQTCWGGWGAACHGAGLRHQPPVPLLRCDRIRSSPVLGCSSGAGQGHPRSVGVCKVLRDPAPSASATHGNVQYLG